MEYTKDIILNIKYDGDMACENKNWTSKVYTNIKENKFIYFVVSVTIFFMGFDIVLVNNFVNLLSRI